VSRLHGPSLPPTEFPCIYSDFVACAAIQRHRLEDFLVMAGTKLVREERVPTVAIAEVADGASSREVR